MKKTEPTTRVDFMFRAFADQTRLRILYLLQEGECCVGNVVDILGIQQPSASRHLAYLRRAKLVVVRKTRQWSYYSLAPATQPFHQKLLECLACCFNQVPKIKADQKRAQKIKEEGGCCPEAEQVGTKKVNTAKKKEECCS